MTTSVPADQPTRGGTTPGDAADPGTDDAGTDGDGTEVVRSGTGRGGLPRLVVTTPAARAEVYLQGAHVTAWAPGDAEPVLWTSAYSRFAPGTPIRGGIPVCFPWFGPHPSGDGPLHGLVRARPWTFAGWAPSGEDVVLTFTLSSADLDEPTARFALRYTVTVGRRLGLALTVTNTDSEPLRFEEALHTYLAVADVREARIEGLGDLDRLDRLSGRRVRTPAGAELHVVGETDHLYSRPGPVTVVDWTGGRSLHLATGGSANAVVWNPWVAKAAAMADLGDDEWATMLCVETCNVADDAVTLAPGSEHTMTTTLEVRPLV